MGFRIRAYSVLAFPIVLSACGRSEIDLYATDYAPADSSTNFGFHDFVDAAIDTPKCKGAWGFAPQAAYPTKGAPFAIAVGDFNRDGYPDLALAYYNDTGTVGVLFNAGNGTFGAPTAYAVGTAPVSIATGDFNRDGYPDLAVTNIKDGTLYVHTEVLHSGCEELNKSRRDQRRIIHWQGEAVGHLVRRSNGFCFTRGPSRLADTNHVAITSASRKMEAKPRLALSADPAENKAVGCKQELGGGSRRLA